MLSLFYVVLAKAMTNCKNVTGGVILRGDMPIVIWTFLGKRSNRIQETTKCSNP